LRAGAGHCKFEIQTPYDLVCYIVISISLLGQGVALSALQDQSGGRVFVVVRATCVFLSLFGVYLLGRSHADSAISSWMAWLGIIASFSACVFAMIGCPAFVLNGTKAQHALIESELRKSEARFRHLADALPQIVWIAKPDGSQATYLNSRWKEYTGLDSANTTVNHKVVHPDDLIAMANRFQESQKTGNVFEYEFRMRPGDTGPYLWFLARGVPVRDEAGQIVEWFGTSTDIDDLKSTQEALREKQRHFRELVESIPQLAWTDLPDGYCDYLSPQWVEYTGVPMKEHLGFGWVDAIHPDDRDKACADWHHSTANGIPLENEFRIRRSDGAYRWFKNRAIPLRNEHGKIVKWFGTNTDIDDLKCAEQKLHEAEARFHRTFDGMEEGCQIIGCDWKYLYINESAAKQGRRTPAELSGRTMMEAFPGIEHATFFPTLVECMLQRTPHRLRTRFDYPEGGFVDFELSIQPCPEGIFILSTEISPPEEEASLQQSDIKNNAAAD
jgi:PAS domain S-box-containing protein